MVLYSLGFTIFANFRSQFLQLVPTLDSDTMTPLRILNVEGFDLPGIVDLSDGDASKELRN